MADAGTEPPKQIIWENTFITEPEGYGQAFVLKPHKMQLVISDVLEQRLRGLTYDPVKGAQRAKQVAEDVKERVKALDCSRHKLIVQVLLGQRKGQAMRVVSRCLWDAHADTSASANFESETMYCVCQVYGLFVE